MKKKLTKAQEELFKKYYLEDYSGSLIFEKIGQPYKRHELTQVTSRMRVYRIKLGLPKRGIGHQPTHRKYPIPKTTRSKRIKKRIQRIWQLIDRTENKLEKYNSELDRLFLELINRRQTVDRQQT
jgi:predicted DNA-binding protein YlxM (UPF0122 family)